MEAILMSSDRGMDKEAVIHTYDGILLSHKKEHIWVSSNDDEPRAYYTEWSKSEREKQISYMNAYIWSLERWPWWTYLQGSSGNTHIENRLADTAGEGAGGTNWESSVETHTLPHVKQITSGDLQYDSGSSNWCSVTTERGRMGWEVGGRFKREATYAYLWLIHVDVWQRPIQYCKAIIIQLKIYF